MASKRREGVGVKAGEKLRDREIERERQTYAATPKCRSWTV